MARYIDTQYLFKCETCRHYTEGQGCNTFCDSGECYSPNMNKIPTADVVPRSEVERLQTEIKVLTENSILAKYPCCVSCSKGLILTESLEEYDKLLADISSEVAREIFTDIEENHADFLFDGYRNIIVITEKDFAELKKKYTEDVK